MNIESNQIFIILAVLRVNVLRVVGSILTAQRLSNTAPKKRRRGDDPLATAFNFRSNDEHISEAAYEKMLRKTSDKKQNR